MGVSELLDRIRDLYVTPFAAAVEKLARRPGVRVLSEAVLVNDAGEPVGAGPLGLPVRLDLVALKDDQVTDRVAVDSDRLLRFQPARFDWSDGLTVLLRPFWWDSLTVTFQGEVGSVDYGPLVAWYREWFGEDGEGGGELLGVVHSLSDPEAVDGEVRFTIDLGSAPVEAFEGLLDAVAALGVAEVALGEADDGHTS